MDKGRQLSEIVFTTKSDSFLKWAQKWIQEKSLCPYPFGVSCCAMEYWALDPRVKNAQFDLQQGDITDSNVLVIAGTVTEKNLPYLLEIYDKMSFPKWTIAMGNCAASGGGYTGYHVISNLQDYIAIDVTIAGCPPEPSLLAQGLILVCERIQKGVCLAEPK